MKVEAVNYEVDWKKFERGSAIFIPCLNPEKAYRQIRRTTDTLRFRILAKLVVVEGVQGLRVWRI